MPKQFKVLLTIAGILPLTAAFLIPAAFAQSSETCLDCHDAMATGLKNTPHALYKTSKIATTIRVDCQSCHDGWRNHIDDPSRDNIIAGNELSLLKQAEVCAGCHVTPHQTAMISSDPHQYQNITCSSCHTVHDNHNNKLLKDNRDDFCLSCHSTIAFAFKQRSVHSLESDNIGCTDCHDMSSIKTGDKNIGFDWGCQNCHDDLSGPFLYEHPVTYNHLVEGESCIECHDPHGSPNDRLLKQSNSGTCRQCHGTPPGHLTNHSGLGAQLECVQCHTEIHGSYVSRLFLDPDLGARFLQDCYQAGCHAINN